MRSAGKSLVNVQEMATKRAASERKGDCSSKKAKRQAQDSANFTVAGSACCYVPSPTPNLVVFTFTQHKFHNKLLQVINNILDHRHYTCVAEYDMVL